jgi:hypothetical protein
LCCFGRTYVSPWPDELPAELKKHIKSIYNIRNYCRKSEGKNLTVSAIALFVCTQFLWLVTCWCTGGEITSYNST